MSLRISRLGGITANADTTNYQAPSIHALFQANAAIDVGAVVQLDTSNLNGKLVKTAVAAQGWNIVGIYEGEGGTGAVTANTKVTVGATAFSADQKKAVTNDLVYVKCYGVAYALVNGGTTDAADGNVLFISATTAGELVSNGTTVATATCQGPRITALEAHTASSSTVAARVFIQG